MHNHMNIKITSAAVIGLGLIGVSVWYVLSMQQEPAVTSPTASPESSLAPEVELVLAKQTVYLQELASAPAILSEVVASNLKNASLSKDDIARLDAEWQATKEITPFIQQFFSNKTAEALIAFQSTHTGFKEIFVADGFGLNVGQTGKTSDYYQADEAWWQNSYNEGIGNVLHGKIEFDESSQSEAISLYVPIIDPASSKAIGVLKGVLDLSAIKSEL